MLWTERYRPVRLEDIRGQDRVIGLLVSCAASGTSPHLMFSGPHGTGKSAAIRCFAERLYGENWEANTSFFQTADLFSQGKKLLEEDERYAHLYQKSQSLIVNFKYILKWYASMRPLDADFKLMVFEDAHALTREAQQGLRRIMEQVQQHLPLCLLYHQPECNHPCDQLALSTSVLCTGQVRWYLSQSSGQYWNGSSRTRISAAQMMTLN